MPADQPFGRPSPVADSVRTVSGTTHADTVRPVPSARVRGVSLDRADTPIRGVSALGVRTAATPLDGIPSQMVVARRKADVGMNRPASTGNRHDVVGGEGLNPRPANAVVLALVVALRDVEQRRGRGKVLTQLTSKRPAA